MSKLSWPPIALSVPLLALGVTLWLNAYVYTSVLPFVGSVVSAAIGVAHTLSERRSRRSTLDMVDWLIDAAQYGTKYVQNAADHDVHDAEDVKRLVARHQQWQDVIKAHANSYLHPSGAA